MILLTEEMKKDLPKIGATEDKPLEEKMLKWKFFCPWSSWKWYPIEYDPKDGIFFGLVDGDFVEWGEFALSELVDLKGPFGMAIERDKYFTPVLYKDLKTTGQG